MKKIFIILFLIILPAHSFAYSDVDNHWAKEYIKYLTDTNIVSGYPDKTFRPDDNITRAEFITMLVKTLKLPLTETDGFWASRFVDSAKKHNIVEDSNNLEVNILREEVVKMLVKSGVNSRIAYKNGNSGKVIFNDMLTFDDETKNSVEILFLTGVISGYSDGSIRLKNELTRAEACTFIFKFIENRDKLDNYNLAIKDMYYGQIRFVSYEDLPYELCEWKNGTATETLVNTVVNSIDMFEFSEKYEGKYKEIFEEIYTSEEPYFKYRKKFGDGKKVIAIEFETHNCSKYETVAGYQYLVLEFPEENIEIIDSFDTDEIDKQRERKSYSGVKVNPNEVRKTIAFYVVDNFPQEIIKLCRYITTMYDKQTQTVVDVESYNSLTIGNLR